MTSLDNAKPRRRRHVFALLCSSTLLTGSGHALAETITFSEPDQQPESVALDRRGNLYASMGRRASYMEISPDGARQEISVPFEVPLPDGALGALGVTVEHRGIVFLTIQACTTSCSDAHGVWRIDRRGRASRLPGSEAILFPNDVTVDPRGNVYVSDSISGAVWISRPIFQFGSRFHAATIWAAGPLLAGTGALPTGLPVLGANGIAFSPAVGGNGEIVVANTEKASIVVVPISHGGQAGTQQVLATDGELLGVDGLDVDRYGDVFAVKPVAIGITGPEFVSTLFHVKRRSGEIQQALVGEPLDITTNVALGKQFGDAKTIWAANPGFLLPGSVPSVVRVPLENAWFEALD